MARSKAQALKSLGARQQHLNDLEARASRAALERDALLLEAQDLGASYADLEDATGLSTARVTQVLRRARQRRSITQTAANLNA